MKHHQSRARHRRADLASPPRRAANESAAENAEWRGRAPRLDAEQAPRRLGDLEDEGQHLAGRQGLHVRTTLHKQFQPDDQVTIASPKQQGQGARAIARMLVRPASTVGHEPQRNTVAGALVQGSGTVVRSLTRCARFQAASTAFRTAGAARP